MSVDTRLYLPPPVPADGEWTEWIGWANQVPSLLELGLECREAEPGHVVLVLPASVWAPNPNGGLNGGMVAAAADHTMGLVALTTMPPGAMPATATMYVEYLCPATAPLTFRGGVSQTGRQLVFVTVDVERADGRLCVRCSGTMATREGVEQEYRAV